jgi:uncharacterized protein (DUF488 family)
VKMSRALFTVGHSTHRAEDLLRLLDVNGVSAIADVRSRPYSRLNPHFNRDALEPLLGAHGIVYRFLGAELGARTEDRSCYVDGKVQYDLLARTPLFRRGLSRVLSGTRDYSVALLCAERDPITCHRMVLVCRELRKEPVEIFHIRADASLESNAEAERRMLEAVALPESGLFTSTTQAIDEAYRRQGERIAWVNPSASSEAASTPFGTDSEARI